MQRTILVSVIALALGLEATAGSDVEFTRYEPIIERQMFGQPPPNFDPDKMPSQVAKDMPSAEVAKEQEQIRKAIRFTAINCDTDGNPVVGFEDHADPKNPVCYYMKVGESQNGWTVREADREKATMTIENREGITVALRLGSDSAQDADAVTRRDAAESSARPVGGGRLLSVGGVGSMRERRARVEDQLRQDAAKREEETRKQFMQLQEELRLVREESKEKAERERAERERAEREKTESTSDNHQAVQGQ